MCGIGGAVALAPGARPDPERVTRIAALLAHRGPDGEGRWQSECGRVQFVHRRLSVIDLATGDQPQQSADGRFSIVFNGEIYNYRELRRELERDGVAFRTESDTEVLMSLLAREWGDALHRLRGMFAFACYDNAEQRLLLARDRFGKKPLYHVDEGGCRYFASSLRALRETSRARWAVDPEALDAYLTLGYIPAPRTIFREVGKLEAGTLHDMRGGAVRVARYWDLARADDPFDGSFEQAVDRADELLNESVAIRLRSDVPLGVFLSGGIDSSLVTAVAARQSPSTIRTFAIGFDHGAFDESPYAESVARHLGTDHLTFRVHANVLELLPQLVRHFGEPFADSSAIPTWILAQHARQHVTVALGGDGGDDAFAGYRWYGNALRLSRLASRLPTSLTGSAGRLVSGVAGLLPGADFAARAGRALSVLGQPDDAARFAALRSFVNAPEMHQLYAGELRESRVRQGAVALDALRAAYARCEGSALRRMLYTDQGSYLAEDLLPKVDVATMAHGLEARAPLLDHELVRFAMTLPDAYLRDESGGKLVLRALLRRHVPPALFERPKQGFSLPLAPWFAGPLQPRIAALADSPRLLDRGWFRRDGLRALVEEHVRGTRDHSQRLYGLLLLDEWLS
jgi:asparagine synthase (glutamine-hydrolysing)